MKKVLLVSGLLVSMSGFAQWVTKTVDNKIDLPYKIAYCDASSGRGLLKLEDVDGELALYVTGSYFCDDRPLVEMALIVNGETKRYGVFGTKSSDSRTIFLYDNLLEAENQELLNDFKKCSSFIIRINESHCTDETYNFNMSGSTSAISFMSGNATKTVVQPKM